MIRFKMRSRRVGGVIKSVLGANLVDEKARSKSAQFVSCFKTKYFQFFLHYTAHDSMLFAKKEIFSSFLRKFYP